MDFKSARVYADVCVDYALAYSEDELAEAFSKTVQRICARPENRAHANSSPVVIQHGPDEVEESPTSTRGGLIHFFAGRPTQSWDSTGLQFKDYYSKLREDLVTCYVPFRSFSEGSFNDAMRLRVYQDSANIIGGARPSGVTKKYSLLAKLLFKLGSAMKPPL